MQHEHFVLSAVCINAGNNLGSAERLPFFPSFSLILFCHITEILNVKGNKMIELQHVAATIK